MPNIKTLPSTDGAAVPVATRTLTVQSLPSIEVPYNILGYESAGSNYVPVDTTNGLPVVVNSSALPSGAATAANQATANTSLEAIAAVLTTPDAADTIWIGSTSYAVLHGFANVTASGETVLVAGVSGKVIRIVDILVGPVGAAVNVYFDNPTDGALCSTKYLAANGGFARYFMSFGFVQTGTAGEALRINLSTSANVPVDFHYILM